MTQKKAPNPQAHLLGLPRKLECTELLLTILTIHQGELRDEIYGYVFEATTIKLKGHSDRIHLDGLTLACKQLYCETNAHFRQIELGVTSKDHLLLWLKRHKSQLGLLPQIKFSKRERRGGIMEDNLSAATNSFQDYNEICSDFTTIKRTARAFEYPGMQKVIQVEMWTDASGSGSRERKKVWTTKPEAFRPAYKHSIACLKWFEESAALMMD